MAITEESRFELHQSLCEVLGPRGAATLMELLPPVGWADVATKRDLDVLSAKIDGVEQRLDAKIDNSILALQVDLANRLNRMLVTMIASVTAIMTLALTVFRLL